MTAPHSLGFVVNFVPSDPPGAWLGTFLSDSSYRTEVIAAIPAQNASWARRRRLPPYLGELLHLTLNRPSLGAYDVLFAWELRTTLAAVLRQRVSRRPRARLVSLNPTLNERVRLGLPVIRRLMRDVDCIVAFSTAEQHSLARQLRIPRERVRYVPRFANVSAIPSQVAAIPNTFVLALGRTNRDFPTLWEALRGTDIRVTMYRNSWMRGREIDNVTAIASLLPAEDEAALVSGAAFHVIPLKDAPFASGLTVLLRAMAQGKAVVVTDTTGISDYVRDGDTAVLVPPGHPGALRTAMLRLWHDPEECSRIGRNAALAVREHFAAETFARRLAGIADELVSGRPSKKEELACASS